MWSQLVYQAFTNVIIDLLSRETMDEENRLISGYMCKEKMRCFVETQSLPQELCFRFCKCGFRLKEHAKIVYHNGLNPSLMARWVTATRLIIMHHSVACR